MTSAESPLQFPVPRIDRYADDYAPNNQRKKGSQNHKTSTKQPCDPANVDGSFDGGGQVIFVVCNLFKSHWGSIRKDADLPENELPALRIRS